MVDSAVQRLIEHAIDSPIKLQLVLMFCEHRDMKGTSTQIAQRVYRDIWSTRAALRELAEDGILSARLIDGEPVYAYRPRLEHMEAIARLCQAYNEPMERDTLQRMVRDVGLYARFRRDAAGSKEFDRSFVAM
jgi:hypothetical protein